MEQMRCANEECVLHTEHRGGKFSFAGGKWWCPDCLHFAVVMNPGRNLHNFTTTHFNGQPVHVQNLKHLRQLEKQYGVSNQAANNMERNWS